MTNPLVSVIMPAYNTEKYIGEAIESVISQTYTEWELIIVDDGSTDRTGEIAEEYARRDSRIRVYHQENQGVSVARNLGIQEAGSGLIALLDSDDLWMNNHLAQIMEAKERFPECLWFASKSEEFRDEAGKNLKSYKQFACLYSKYVCCAMHMSRKWYIANCSNSAVDRELILSLGGFEPKVSKSQDSVLLLLVALHTPLAYCSMTSVLIRVNRDGSSNTKHYAHRVYPDYDKYIVMLKESHAEKEIIEMVREWKYIQAQHALRFHCYSEAIAILKTLPPSLKVRLLCHAVKSSIIGNRL